MTVAAYERSWRCLERHRRHVPADDPAVATYVDAMAEIAAASSPVLLRLAGLTLTSGGVLGCGFSDNASADYLREATAKVLAARTLDWFERDFRRDMWHLTLAHFTGPIHSPRALVDWVAARRERDLGMLSANALDLVRAQHDGSTIRLATLARAELGTGQVG